MSSPELRVRSLGPETDPWPLSLVAAELRGSTGEVKLAIEMDRATETGATTTQPTEVVLQIVRAVVSNAADACRGLGVATVVFGQLVDRDLDRIFQLAAQAREIGSNRLEHGFGRWVVQQREQQVLDGDELVALLARLDERHVQADFQFLRNHAASIMHCSGCWSRFAAASTSSTLVDATSLVKTPQTARPS